MKNDPKLQSDVPNAIKWEPFLNAAEIGVKITSDALSLIAILKNYAKKFEAINTAKEVFGIKALDSNSKVQFPLQ